MSKIIPTDAIIVLYNQLSALRAHDPKRRTLIDEAASFYSVSAATVYRALRQHNKPKTVYRSDYNQPRTISREEMQRYCELIAALRMRTTNKKGHHLSVNHCIQLLEDYGVETPTGLIKAPLGLLKKSMVSIYLNRLGLSREALAIQPTVIHFQAEYSNQCWHFDFSPSDFKYFEGDKKSSSESLLKLMIASVVDDRSGVTYQEYHYVHGEDVQTALLFLFNAMASKKRPNCPFQGIPKLIYLDNGPVAKSLIFKRVMHHLGIEIKTHMPDGKDGRRKTARSKGKVERRFHIVKSSLETLYHFHKPKDLEESNQWLHHYWENNNQEKHRTENHSRLEDWKLNLPPEGFQAMCNWSHFSMLCREPETRKVGSDACVSIEGTKYQLISDLAGLTVTLLWGLFDQELRVEHEGKNYGPFYPYNGPIPLGQYRRFKKSQREKYADKITDLSKAISIPKAVLTGQDEVIEQRLNALGLTEDKPPFVPFTVTNPFEQTCFKDSIEAKSFIAYLLGYPLGRLLPQQLQAVEAILAETLDKSMVTSQIKALFEIKLLKQNEVR